MNIIFLHERNHFKLIISLLISYLAIYSLQLRIQSQTVNFPHNNFSSNFLYFLYKIS